MFLEFDGIRIEVVKKRVKRIRLTIKPDRSIILSMPMRTPLKDGEDFARGHIPWIKKHLSKMQDAPQNKNETFEDGSKILLFGKPYAIRINEQKCAITKLYGDFLILSVPVDDQKHREAAVLKFYSEALLKYAEEKIAYYVSLHHFTMNGLKLRKMKSRWGSCNVNTKVITLNLTLAEKKEDLIDYVIMHELIHTIVPNHGKSFYAYFDRYMPDHKERRKKLNGRK